MKKKTKQQMFFTKYTKTHTHTFTTIVVFTLPLNNWGCAETTSVPSKHTHTYI